MMAFYASIPGMVLVLLLAVVPGIFAARRDGAESRQASRPTAPTVELRPPAPVQKAA